MRNISVLCALLLAIPAVPLRGQSALLDPVPGTTPALTQLAAGVVPDDIDRLEAALNGGGGAAVQLGRGSAQRAITELGFALRGTGPALVATADDPGIRLLVALAARDSLAVRRGVAAVDAARRRLAVRNLPPPLLLAQALLWLGDTTTALAQLTEFERNAAEMNPAVTWGMVRNDWLVPRTMALLTQLRARTGAGRDDGRYLLRLRPASAERRVRYDAVMWARLPGQADADTGRVLARMTMHATERAATAAGTVRWVQQYDGLSVDLPVRQLLGMDDLAMRRQVRDASRDLSAETVLDASGRVLRREVRAAAPLPDELRGALEDGTGFMPMMAMVSLPSRAVAVGESWSDSVRLWAPGGLFDPDTRAAATYRLERVTTAGDRRLAFVALDARLGGTVNAVLSGEVVLDLDRGDVVRIAASLRASVSAGPDVRVLLTALREPAAAPVTTVAIAPSYGMPESGPR